MELYFNELSINDSVLSYFQVQTLIDIYKKVSKYNISSCRISHEDHLKIFSMFKDLPNAENIINFYYSFFKAPYESEVIEKEQDEYLNNTWLYDGKDCFGLALACLVNSISLSIYDICWDNTIIEINRNDENVNVRNISLPDHVDVHIDFFDKNIEINLEKCPLSKTEKNIHLRDDHGSDKLMEFSKKIVCSPYICEIINSLPFNSHKRKFIKEVKSNGIIEIVLPWTDQGLGIVVKTTGRNMRESKQIADILEKEYGHL